MNENEKLEITKIDDLIKYKEGTIVELPPFGEGQPFIARIKRPSMLALIQGGKIPNSLLKAATELFTGKNSYGMIGSDEALKNVTGVLETLCEACFLEPTYKQIKESGIELTDDQLMFIFNYTQNGVKALESFRTK